MFSSGIRWPRLAAHDREEERGSLSASRATGGPLRVRSARSGGGGQNGCCLPSGGVGTACDGLDLPSRFEGCRADGIVHSIQERSRSPRPRTLGDRGKGLDSPCPMDGGILGRRAMEEKDASAVALAWTCSSCRPYSSRSLTGRLPSGWGVAVAVTVTMAVGELGRDGVVGGSSSSAGGCDVIGWRSRQHRNVGAVTVPSPKGPWPCERRWTRRVLVSGRASLTGAQMAACKVHDGQRQFVRVGSWNGRGMDVCLSMYLEGWRARPQPFRPDGRRLGHARNPHP